MRQVVSLLAVVVSMILVPKFSGASWEVASADHVVGVIPLEKKDMIAIVGGKYCWDSCYDCVYVPALGYYQKGKAGHDWECRGQEPYPDCYTEGTNLCYVDFWEKEKGGCSGSPDGSGSYTGAKECHYRLGGGDGGCLP